MSSSFSERFGYKPKREFLQVESIDPPLKNALWNAFYLAVWEELPHYIPDWAMNDYLYSWGKNFFCTFTVRLFF